jgi:hypothetical protein
MEVGQGPNWGCSAKEKKDGWDLEISYGHRSSIPNLLNISHLI